MADGVFNIARGYVGYYCSLPAASDGIVIVLLKSSGLQADATLVDHDNLSVILAASNDECDFTNYARKAVSSTTPATDDTNDRFDIDLGDLTWSSAGGASNNTIGKLLVCYDGNTGTGDDTNITPLTHHDFSFTTTGADLTAVINTSGFYRSS